MENHNNRVCRTCLCREFDDPFASLYKVIDLENGESREIFKIIENCISLQIAHTDQLPQFICTKCTTMIASIYVFREQCHTNDTHLREQLDHWSTVKGEIKVEESLPNVGDAQYRTVEEVKILELPEIGSFGHEDFEKTVGKLDEVDVFEDCPADLVDDDDDENSFSGHDDHDDFDVELEVAVKQTNTIKLRPCSSKDQVLYYEESDDKIENEHNDAELKKIFHKCDICYEMFDNRQELLFHRRANHINEISEDYYTIVKKDNKTHYICKICKRFCKHKNILRVHLRSHTGEKPYKCAVCSQSFAQKWHSRKHMEIHNLETIEKKQAIFYRCGSCKEGFESETAVKVHYEQHHPPNREKEKVRVVSKPVEKLCDICGKFMKDLTEHLRWHAGKKKYECKICGRILSTPSSLSQHRQRHSDEKKYVCDTCGKSFKIQHDLTFHRKIHFEERKHECHLCGRKFLHKVRLRIHLKVHAGEKPYQVYDNRKKEKKRLQRLEMLKNGTPLPKPKPRTKKERLLSAKETDLSVISPLPGLVAAPTMPHPLSTSSMPPQNILHLNDRLNLNNLLLP